MLFAIDTNKYRMVDISYTVEPNECGGRPFVVRQGRLADDAFKFDMLHTHTHVGTHVEAPAHFFEDAKEVTELPLDTFDGRAAAMRPQ